MGSRVSHIDPEAAADGVAALLASDSDDRRRRDPVRHRRGRPRADRGPAARAPARRYRLVRRRPAGRHAVARPGRHGRRAIAGTEAIHGHPAPDEAGPVGQMVRGSELAAAEVSGTTAVLLWPSRMAWVGPRP